LQAEVEDDDGFALVETDDVGRTGFSAGFTAIAPVSVDPGIQPHIAGAGMGVNAHLRPRNLRDSAGNFG